MSVFYSLRHYCKLKMTKFYLKKKHSQKQIQICITNSTSFITFVTDTKAHTSYSYLPQRNEINYTVGMLHIPNFIAVYYILLLFYSFKFPKCRNLTQLQL